MKPVRLSLAWAWALVVLLAAGHNAWLWLGQGVTPATDILALLPVEQRDPVLARSFSQMVDAAQQRVVVLVGAPEWDDAVRAADSFGAVLAPHKKLVFIEDSNLADTADWLAPFRAHALVLMSAQQEQALAHDAPAAWIDGALARAYGAFAGPRLGAFRDDPFGLFSGWVQERAGETPVRPRDGRLFVAGEGRQYVLLSLRLGENALSRNAHVALLPLLERARQAAQHSGAGVEVLSAGVVLHAAAAGEQAEREMSTIGAGSLLGIIVLTWLAFRSVRPIGFILLSIGVGLLGALSVCWLLFGQIHLLTLVFGASLIGVAQDYGLYVLCHRQHERRGDSAQLVRRLLPALALTLAAAAIGYLGLALTPFPGLRHMAVFSATGLVFAALTVVCWFPVLLRAPVDEGALARRYVALLDSWPRWPARWRESRPLALAGLLAVLAILGCARLGVNDDIRALQTPPAHLVREQIKLGKLLDAPTPVQYYLVRAGLVETLLQREEDLKRRLVPLVAAGHISGYQAVSNWAPSARTQAGRRALAEQGLLAAGGPLDTLGRALGEDPNWAEATRAHLREAGAPMEVDAFLASRAGEPARHLWLGEVAGSHASVVALRGLRYASLPVLAAVARDLPGVQWVDKVGDISSLLGRYRQGMGWVVLGAYAAVFALLALRYRAGAWRVMAGPALAAVATLALLGFAGQALTLFHVLALMLLLGVGVDYGIFMQERGRAGAAWLAVGLSAANTLLSFGLLALSGTPALHAFGLTMLVGTALLWLTAPCFVAVAAVELQEEVQHVAA